MTGAWEPLEVEPQYPQHLKIINKGVGDLGAITHSRHWCQHWQPNRVTCPGGGVGRFPDTLQS